MPHLIVGTSYSKIMKHSEQKHIQRNIQNHLFSTYLLGRVTSLEQMSVAEFSGVQTWLKVYENGHKKVLGIWLDLVLKVKYRKILIFKAIFQCQKSAETLRKKKFLEEYKNGGLTFITNIF